MVIRWTPSNGVGSLNMKLGYTEYPKQYNLYPGSIVSIPKVLVSYSGPRIRVMIGAAWMGRNAGNWDNGEAASYEKGMMGFSGYMILPESPTRVDVLLEWPLSTSRVNLIVPDPAVQHRVRGKEGESPRMLTFADAIAAWVWIINLSALEAAGMDTSTSIYSGQSPATKGRLNLTNEAYFLKGGGFGGITSDSGVVRVLTA